jgi:hypothetical protein
MNGQLEAGVLTEFIGNTTSAAVSVGPVSGLPRLDYLGSTCPRLLLEPQRTNLALYSEQFNNAGWTKANASVTANAGTSPDGYANADLVTTTTTTDLVQQSFTLTTGTAYTGSVFLKAGTETDIAVLFTGAAFPAVQTVSFNLTTKQGTVTSGTPSFSIIDFGNGWLRCTITATTTSTGAGNFRIASLSLDAVSSYYAYGAQLEAGAYATSYIPTLGTSVTRVADACSKTGISSLIGQTEGTIYWEGQISSTTGFPQLCDLNADGNKYIQIYNSLVSGTPRIGLYIQNVSLLLNLANIATISFNTNLKFALAYKNNDYAAYLNGNLVYTNTTIGVPPTSNFGIAAVEQTVETAGKKVDQALLFKTRLTNAQLAELTA